MSHLPGKCRLAENGLGWRPAGGGDTFTLDRTNILTAQWSRGSRGYELKLYTSTTGVVQLDGFAEEVSVATNPPSITNIVSYRRD